MKSPITGKHMPIRISQVDMQFRGEHFWVSFIFYLCEESKESFTDDVLDKLNVYQVHQQYAAKHDIPIEELQNVG